MRRTPPEPADGDREKDQHHIDRQRNGVLEHRRAGLVFEPLRQMYARKQPFHVFLPSGLTGDSSQPVRPDHELLLPAGRGRETAGRPADGLPDLGHEQRPQSRRRGPADAEQDGILEHARTLTFFDKTDKRFQHEPHLLPVEYRIPP